MSTNTESNEFQQISHDRPCIICGSKSIGTNFGVVTCSPCKAFFRRNARRKELLAISCRHREINIFLQNNSKENEKLIEHIQIRRCSSCRLRRCFEEGMKEDLIRTDEQNERFRQLVDINRRRRNISHEQTSTVQHASAPRLMPINADFSDEIDWTHLSNIVYAYDKHCLKMFSSKRTEIVFNPNSPITEEQKKLQHPTGLTMCVVLGVSAFMKSLPAFYSLRRNTRNYLCKTNIRPLIFPNIHELNQSCYSEAWQTEIYDATWKFICGPELYERFTLCENLGKSLWFNDPIIIRVWFVILFFSTPLHYRSDGPIVTPVLKKKQIVLQTQNIYADLLWKYLIHRYGTPDCYRIFTNLVRVYIQMQTVGFNMYLKLKSEQELKTTNETLDKLVTSGIKQE